ncbi:hypothetical protein JOF53_008436 [Crossiella equi]|uniref:Uncharacterized protein n=1 Tax=Crossiella equi TaxID=130796 RepID=A0ABS5ASK4_9PSEU|nr:hypothetical protein [Crossiella equi]MBP2479564.1 hypothetical protein [Crossiella equi]
MLSTAWLVTACGVSVQDRPQPLPTTSTEPAPLPTVSSSPERTPSTTATTPP